jgi:hypothetical protein
MNKETCNPISIIATGFIVLVLLSLVLFCARFFIISNMHRDSSRVIISPSGLIPDEPVPKRAEEEAFVRYGRGSPGPDEPNFRYSGVYAGIASEGVLFSAVGALWDIMAETNSYRDVNERIYYFYADKNNNSCFDKRSGLIIRRYEDKKSGPVEFFVGPNGVSMTADSSLGRFYDPIIIGVWGGSDLYDKKTRCFYAIDFDKRKVSKGPQLAEGDSREPIVMAGGIRDRDIFFTNKVYVEWSGPKIWNVEKGEWVQQGVFLPGSSEKYDYSGPWARTYIPVLDKTGRIHIYNTEGRSLAQCGYLPMPRSPFKFDFGQQSGIANPRNVLSYTFWPVTASQRLPADTNKSSARFDVKYLGMCVACVSREGMAMAVAVFDPNGRLVYRGDIFGQDSPSATTITTILFLLENLQPPVFEIASYLCGDSIEPSAGHRALFILPNSFIGMLGRYEGTTLEREVFFPLLMGPSLILSVWLAYRVRKDAKTIGLSGTAKKWWTVGTFAFGLPAYITYRLTRPKETLVTCQNCGQLRRPDMERCHRCGSKWEMPELTPPNWRIRD